MVRGGTAHCGVDTRTRAARGSSRGPSVRHARPAARSSRMSALGQFYGIALGPGRSGLIPVAAITAVRAAERLFVPRETLAIESLARQGLGDRTLPPERFRGESFQMEADRSPLGKPYLTPAQTIYKELRA